MMCGIELCAVLSSFMLKGSYRVSKKSFSIEAGRMSCARFVTFSGVSNCRERQCGWYSLPTYGISSPPKGPSVTQYPWKDSLLLSLGLPLPPKPRTLSHTGAWVISSQSNVQSQYLENVSLAREYISAGRDMHTWDSHHSDSLLSELSHKYG